MTIEEIKQLIERPEYDFLRTDPHLAGRIMFLTLGGSYAYGLNTETSDVDLRGCALNSPAELLGLSHFEQRVDIATDTTVYGFMRFIQLLLSCNPHVIETLGCKPEHYIIMTELGQELIDNRKLFLSQRAIRSFGGYATAKLRRLENAVARDRVPQARMEEHIRNSMESACKGSISQLPSLADGQIRLYTDVSAREGLEREIFADIHLKKFPARDFSGLLNNLSNVFQSYASKGHRNHKKDDLHINKHAMHLVRLYLTGLDVLEKGDIFTYRGNDHNLLMEIRNGKYMLEDGTYRSEFFDLVNELDKRLAYAKENTNLPPEPDKKKIEELVMDVNRRGLYV